MHVMTEAAIRALIKKDKITELVVNPKTIVTPSAREYLNANKIKLVFEKEDPKYVDKETGAFIEKKPEEMTQLYGKELVRKDHPSIVFRGKADSLQSKILEVQVMADKSKCEQLTQELQEILQYVRNLIKAEVIKQETSNIMLFGLSEEVLRKMSHHPKQYFGVEHVLPDYKMGAILIGLNAIRSGAREVELSSIPLDRLDITKSLNRLSSAVYVMMCRYLSGYYK